LKEIKPDIKSVPFLYGLIGFPLSHTFSSKYFLSKFDSLGLNSHHYEPFPLKDLELEFPRLILDFPNLLGLNVTIPFKERVIPFLDSLSEEANLIGAVNCIKIEDGYLTGYNTDAYGFEKSILPLLQNKSSAIALILGTGGASKAVHFVLKKLGFRVIFVSRHPDQNQISYPEIDSFLLRQTSVIVNTTPLGMYPEINNCPQLPYHLLNEDHILIDLVYNPEKTLFLQKGEAHNCTVKNGYEMLTLQAEKSWEIWKN
jgi:shikimate dehydrogenase